MFNISVLVSLTWHGYRMDFINYHKTKTATSEQDAIARICRITERRYDFAKFSYQIISCEPSKG